MHVHVSTVRKRAIPSLQNTVYMVHKERSSNGAPTLNAVVQVVPFKRSRAKIDNALVKKTKPFYQPVLRTWPARNDF